MPTTGNTDSLKKQNSTYSNVVALQFYAMIRIIRWMQGITLDNAILQHYSPTPLPILLHSALLYSTLLYSTLLYSTLLNFYSILLYSTLLYSTLLNFFSILLLTGQW